MPYLRGRNIYQPNISSKPIGIRPAHQDMSTRSIYWGLWVTTGIDLLLHYVLAQKCSTHVSINQIGHYNQVVCIPFCFWPPKMEHWKLISHNIKLLNTKTTSTDSIEYFCLKLSKFNEIQPGIDREPTFLTSVNYSDNIPQRVISLHLAQLI